MNINLYLLKFFYLKPYKKQAHGEEAREGRQPCGNANFYEEFYGRLSEAGEVLSPVAEG